MGSIEQLKYEVTDEYVKQFKKELGWFNSIIILPVENKVKDIIIGKKALPKEFNELTEFGRRKQVIEFVSKSTALELFAFMKEKRLSIEQKKTASELRALKDEILGINQDDDEPLVDIASNHTNAPETNQPAKNISPDDDSEEYNSTRAGITTAATGVALAGVDKARSAKESKKMAQHLSADKLRSTAQESIDILKGQLSNGRLTSRQVANIQHSIEQFEAGLGSIDDSSVAVFQKWQSFAHKLPKNALDMIVDPLLLKKLGGREAELVGKSVTEMKAILSTHNITGISDEFLALLSKADNVAEMKAIQKVMQHTTTLKKVIKTIKGALVLDLAFLGFDVWLYFDTLNDARALEKINALRAENMKHKATTHLGIGVSTLVLEAALLVMMVKGGGAVGSVGGPVGTGVGMVAGLCIGAVSYGVSQGVDSLYFDVQDFYKQSKEDYLKQSTAQLKQTLLQQLHNHKKGNKSLNEKLGAPDKKQKLHTMQQAWESVLFLDQMEQASVQQDPAYGLLVAYQYSQKTPEQFVASLSSEEEKTSFSELKAIVDKNIALRVQYIDNSLHTDKVIAGLESAQGMSYLTDLITQSRIYALLHFSGAWQETRSYDENLESYGSSVLRTIPELQRKNIEVLYTNAPTHFSEVYFAAKAYAPLFEADDLTTEELMVKKNIEYICAYYEFLTVTRGTASLVPSGEKNLGTINYRYCLAVLENNFSTQGIEFTNFSNVQVSNIDRTDTSRKNILPVSDSVAQNVLYRLATELYGYTGQNTSEELMAYFTESKGSTHGLYYKDGRYINNDRAKDQKMDLQILDKQNFPDQQAVTKKVTTYVDSLFYRSSRLGAEAHVAGALLPGSQLLFSKKKGAKKSLIDTPTEAVDGYLIDEFLTTFTKILTEELSYRTVEKKQHVQDNIVAFIKQHASDGGYVELPYYLIYDALKSGMGDLQAYQFSYRNDKIFCHSDMRKKISLGTVEVHMEYTERLRDSFTSDEQRYIHDVEMMHQQLEQVRGLSGKWAHKDDLALPKEIGVLISDAYKSRNAEKNKRLLQTPAVAKRNIVAAHQKYTSYFGGLYKGILLSLHGFSFTNNIDTYAYYQQAVAKGSQELFDEKGGLLKDSAGKPLIAGAGIEKMYTEQLSVQKYENKTIASLRVSLDPEDKKKAKRASEQIILTLLEISKIQFDKKGLPVSLYAADATVDLTQLDLFPHLTEVFTQRVKQRLAEDLQVNDQQVAIDYTGVTFAPEEETTIQHVTKEKEQLILVQSVLQQKIESTADTLVRQGKRGDIRYNIHEHTLESRGGRHSLEIVGDKIKLPGLDQELSISSGVWLANFINRYRFTYKATPATMRKGLTRTWPFRVVGLFHDQTNALIISQDNLKKHCLEIDDTNIQAMVGLLST